MIRMTKFIFLVLFTFNTWAQNIKTPEYISLNTQKVYDVEIIVFAYDTPLPNAQTYGNKPVYDTSLAFELDFKPDDMAIIKKADVKENDGKYTIDIDGKDNSILILAWFEHDASKFQLANVWNKLQNNQKTTPLLHRAWRQPETEFESPQYINILPSNRIFDRIIGEDMAITGQVALSKGRYLHFTNQLNLFRSLNTTYADEGEIDESPDLVFSLTEREQVKSGELHYFDNPWFGTLVKITEYKGEETNE
jgi:hypothetical protein